MRRGAPTQGAMRRAQRPMQAGTAGQPPARQAAPRFRARVCGAARRARQQRALGSSARMRSSTAVRGCQRASLASSPGVSAVVRSTPASAAQRTCAQQRSLPWQAQLLHNASMGQSLFLVHCMRTC